MPRADAASRIGRSLLALGTLSAIVALHFGVAHGGATDDTRALQWYTADHIALIHTRSGVRVQEVEMGTGGGSAKGDRVTVITKMYIQKEVRLQNGRVDPAQTILVHCWSNTTRDEAVVILLGESNSDVLQGLVDGVMQMRLGGKRKLLLPAHLAYGDEGNPSLGVGSDKSVLIFVEVVRVEKAGYFDPNVPPPLLLNLPGREPDSVSEQLDSLPSRATTMPETKPDAPEVDLQALEVDLQALLVSAPPLPTPERKPEPEPPGVFEDHTNPTNHPAAEAVVEVYEPPLPPPPSATPDTEATETDTTDSDDTPNMTNIADAGDAVSTAYTPDTLEMDEIADAGNTGHMVNMDDKLDATEVDSTDVTTPTKTDQTANAANAADTQDTQDAAETDQTADIPVDSNSNNNPSDEIEITTAANPGPPVDEEEEEEPPEVVHDTHPEAGTAEAAAAMAGGALAAAIEDKEADEEEAPPKEVEVADKGAETAEPAQSEQESVREAGAVGSGSETAQEPASSVSEHRLPAAASKRVAEMERRTESGSEGTVTSDTVPALRESGLAEDTTSERPADNTPALGREAEENEPKENEPLPPRGPWVNNRGGVKKREDRAERQAKAREEQEAKEKAAQEEDNLDEGWLGHVGHLLGFHHHHKESKKGVAELLGVQDEEDTQVDEALIGDGDSDERVEANARRRHKPARPAVLDADARAAQRAHEMRVAEERHAARKRNRISADDDSIQATPGIEEVMAAKLKDEAELRKQAQQRSIEERERQRAERKQSENDRRSRRRQEINDRRAKLSSRGERRRQAQDTFEERSEL